MATFRYSVAALAVLCLACTPQEPTNASAPAATATIARQQIDHVTPRRDFVGPAPARLEWTAVEGVESYNITVMTEIDTLVFQHTGARGTSIDWPSEIKLEPGTYFWRVVGVQAGRAVADSGRAAFVVSSP